ncbi:hypothetical protein [uncultured Litoreibacter sp.]|uniref:hypothetical protein n=1 Tax=uncultured Litoreibacter sp. TaxID=1392394 RepID=UPI002636D68A|nr:hypothetical protein [uncultured Litoreibacter sp.]
MTTVISRLYADAKTANAAVADLKKAGYKDDMLDVIKPGPSVKDAMEQARVGSAAIETYASHLTGSNTLVVVRAPLMPPGAAYVAMDCVDAHPSVNAGVANQNEYIRESFDRSRFGKSVGNHRHIIGQDLTPGYSERYGLVTQAFGLKHLKPHRTKRSAIEGGGFKSRMFWPMPLLKKKDGSSSAISGGAHMSKFFWPMPLISRREASAKTW